MSDGPFISAEEARALIASHLDAEEKALARADIDVAAQHKKRATEIGRKFWPDLMLDALQTAMEAPKAVETVAGQWTVFGRPFRRTELLASAIAAKVFPDPNDRERRDELKVLLVVFAQEIKRSAIEP